MQHTRVCGQPQERGEQEAEGRGTTSSQTNPGESGLGKLDLEIHTTGARVSAGVLCFGRGLTESAPPRGGTEDQSTELCHRRLVQERGPGTG